MKRIMALALAALVLMGCFGGVFAAGEGTEATILFTHDLHSHFLPAVDEDGGEYGGYARLMTKIREQREIDPDAILVDGGDFAMGSLFQTAYPTAALELRMMGAMGYDVTTFGNHEYDYLSDGLCSMLYAAMESGERVPAIVEANFLPPDDAEEIWQAYEDYGVAPYILMERGGVVYAILGISGYDCRDCAPSSGMVLEEPAVAAQRTVDEAVAAAKEAYGREPVVVCLSHSGTEDGMGEDYELAQAVTGIDLIVSAHTHSTHQQPIVVGDTWIVSAGNYGKYLGVVKLNVTGDDVEFTGYELIPIDETVADDPEIAGLVEQYKAEVESGYLADYGMTFDQVLLENPYKFDNSGDTKRTAHESTLGNVFSDAYKWAVEQATGEKVDLALTASGVIRETIPVGAVRVSDIFNAASLGVGTEGELIAIYVTGSDLMNVFEVDASVYPLMHDAQLFCAGAEYRFNTNRMIFNRVDHAMLRRNDGSLEEIDPDKLYRVVTGTYAGQMLGNVEATSMGLLTITPREADGTVIDPADLLSYVVRDENGVPVKEWYAIASYLDQMGDEMDPHYAEPDGRKVIYSSWNPVKLLRNANKFTWIAIGAIVLVVLMVVGIVKLVKGIIRKIRKKR
ncbi:MAG: bifunctional metallophosphatase/5'-nucleotidase [Oscillospiraceae bacterium]|nr:bifunctional metallophosphatase/5'-nucleotidase [Oscillospiraceae bacterium]